ncbi:PREDICTED: kinesin-like protein KIF3A [Branchiostoma belcheri]|uniref:Kinesin-like protein n=1 Tax=Branchiostoma belcheri TaxID=7741 RepID=A0A6P4YQU2_BRABE|nr:PREDICTED: kinesin-like protein KIF3A [Branchiostoma belcheri]
MDLLEEWLSHNGERATIEVLVDALLKAHLQNVVDGLKNEFGALPVRVNLSQKQHQQEQIAERVQSRILEFEERLITVDVLRDPDRLRKARQLLREHKAFLIDLSSGSVILFLMFQCQKDLDGFYHNHDKVGEGTLSHKLSSILIPSNIQEEFKATFGSNIQEGTQLIVRLQVKREDYEGVRDKLEKDGPAERPGTPQRDHRRSQRRPGSVEGDTDTQDDGAMSTQDCNRLQLHKYQITQKLQVDDVLDHLLEERVINDRDVGEIMDSNDEQKASVLLDILPRRGARAYDVFYDSLLLCESTDYSDLVLDLDRTEMGGTGQGRQPRNRIQVVIRVRPLQGKGQRCLSVDSSKGEVTIHTDQPELKKHKFDEVFNEETTQEKIYDTMASPIVDAVLEGYNGCILCYGKTGSGKTYTMAGPSDRDLNEKTEGIIYRALKQLFLKSQKKQEWDISFFISVFEVYEEKVYDLTVSLADRRPLNITEDTDASVFYASNLKKHGIANAREATKVFFKASQARRTRPTKANDQSSRSHMVFLVEVTILHKEGAKPGRKGQLCLVDLAGSESATGKDTGFINKSLFHLKEVIRFLSEKKSKNFIFRLSTLTKLLKTVLAGNSRTAFIINVDPSKKSLQPTRRSLEFASHAKKVPAKPKINYIAYEDLCRRYLKEIGKLKRQLKALAAGQSESDETAVLTEHATTAGVEKDPEKVDANEVRELVNSILTNTEQESKATLDDLLGKGFEEIKSEILAQTTDLKKNLDVSEKLLQEVHSTQQHVLEQLQPRQLLTNIQERRAEEQHHSRDDTSGQLDDHVQQMNRTMEEFTTVHRKVEEHLRNISANMKNESAAGAAAADEQTSQPIDGGQQQR